MRIVAVLFLFAVISGCTDYLHTKKCLEPRKGYQACHHVHEYWTENACKGSCQ